MKSEKKTIAEKQLEKGMGVIGQAIAATAGAVHGTVNAVDLALAYHKPSQSPTKSIWQ